MLQILRLLRAAAGSDRDLLDRYARDRDEEAFEALVGRYGTGVWAACVRLAGRDAEDAFQAVFIILARKAGAVTGPLPAWLHGVARRVAANLRRNARRRVEVEATVRPPEPLADDVSLREGLALLDEELSRLPERYRAVLIVCCLDGRSRDEAAVQLGWSEGQVKGRLERAREMLRARLARRGVELGGVLLAAAVAGPIPVRADPPSAAAVTLTHGVTRAMLIQKFRLAAAAVAVGVALAGGVVLRAQPGDPPPAAPNGASPEPPNVPKDLLANRGGAAGPQDRGKASPKDPTDESARKEIEDLRKRVEALEKLLKSPAPERQKIVVTSPLAKDVVVTQQYVGKIHAHRHIDVSPLMSGFITDVSVKDGQAVKKGDVLFKVLPTLSTAKLDAERAEVRIAQIEFDGTRKLVEQKVVSQQELAIQEAKLAKAKARAALAEAELNSAVVRAPFDGLLGRLEAQEGSLAKQGDRITTLSDNSVVWVYFNVPEARYLQYMADRDQKKEGSPVELVLANGRKFPQTGKLAAIEGQFGNNTGTIPFRADFPNPDRLLRHGQTGTVLIRESLKNAIVIPQRAMFELGNKRYVYVVGKDDVAHRREIVVQNETGDVFVVGRGLTVNDKIVVDGVRQVRDGEKLVYELRRPEDVIGSPETGQEK
ncbi:MAG TPA: efflux RND transporter periplasmic adaptor subunit [Urbifossiella sp.]|nr:efflux RND transporter periplasmic adaptor subunit [Urbifossiella sp.]